MLLGLEGSRYGRETPVCSSAAQGPYGNSEEMVIKAPQESLPFDASREPGIQASLAPKTPEEIHGLRESMEELGRL